jgi:hypothetical protein
MEEGCQGASAFGLQPNYLFIKVYDMGVVHLFGHYNPCTFRITLRRRAGKD